MGKLNIVKMSVLPKLIYKLSATQSKYQQFLRNLKTNFKIYKEK